eukprot:TRINITY_DN5813_c0_g1_i1.p1 TRINITY_DN5813_c0_g1~~TRINITY_DN5813_c0_g1_i1.p1  ORF type:complete len:168 (+),score=20.07 TRINITY_DN5813_c0_g1_i1:249-752(+)
MLVREQKEMEEANIVVVLVSFVAGEGARQWRGQVGADPGHYLMLIDPQRTLYKKFGLGCDGDSVWSVKVLAWYAWQKLRGKTLHPADGDPTQLGGDFLLGKQSGRCIMAYRSTDPLDRPTVRHILDTLHRYNSCTHQTDVQCCCTADGQEAEEGKREREEDSKGCAS